MGTNCITGCLPENNCQEAWHKIAKRAIKMYLRGSTTKCLELAIPLLARMDSMKMAVELKPMELQCVPTKTLEKALKVYQKGLTMVFTDTPMEYLVLRRGLLQKSITKTMVNNYRKMMEGSLPVLQGQEKVNKVKKLKALRNMAKTFRVVKLANKGTIPVSTMYNPMGLECRCWAGRHEGICSHILSVNAYEAEIDLEELLSKVDTKKKRGRTKRIHYLEPHC